ncbi:aspartate racemase [Alteromonadaceae bacterium 2753L.S.0a.02]|nr:aspartate racemase [Alteromonadaceae bacterium 2753L.S.0a.02]
MYKKIGIIGGLSPESTVSYYLHIIHSCYETNQNYNYPEIIIYSVNLQNYHNWREENRWDLIASDLVCAANNLQKAGAEFGVIATNTMHMVFDEVQSKTSLPLINLIEVTASAIEKLGASTVGLLGTNFTMASDFYKLGLATHKINTIVPNETDQDTVHNIIVNELVVGIISASSRKIYAEIIQKLMNAGAQAVILGCTEIPLLIQQKDANIPVIDTAKIHAEAALQYAKSG